MVHWVLICNKQECTPSEGIFVHFHFLVKYHLHILCSFIRVLIYLISVCKCALFQITVTTAVASTQTYIYRSPDGISVNSLGYAQGNGSVPKTTFPAHSQNTCFTGTLASFFCFHKCCILWFKFNTNILAFTSELIYNSRIYTTNTCSNTVLVSSYGVFGV